MNENELSKIVVDCIFKVHKNLGPGLLESAYEECLFYELSKTNLNIERQKPLPLFYETIKMEIGYRLDFLIENKVVIEVKAVVARESLQALIVRVAKAVEEMRSRSPLEL